jgi:hypothetical protein
VASYFLARRKPEEIKVINRVSASAAATATVALGGVHQNQTVTVNGQAADLPAFTITEQPFSYTPTYHVVPDKPISTHQPSKQRPVEKSAVLIQGLPRPVGNATIEYLGVYNNNGHWQVGLRSYALWTDNTIDLPSGERKGAAIWVSIQGEPVYVLLNDQLYDLTVDAPRTPADGSPSRVLIHLSAKGES